MRRPTWRRREPSGEGLPLEELVSCNEIRIAAERDASNWEREHGNRVIEREAALAALDLHQRAIAEWVAAKEAYERGETHSGDRLIDAEFALRLLAPAR